KRLFVCCPTVRPLPVLFFPPEAWCRGWAPSAHTSFPQRSRPWPPCRRRPSQLWHRRYRVDTSLFASRSLLNARQSRRKTVALESENDCRARCTCPLSCNVSKSHLATLPTQAFDATIGRRPAE